MDNFLIGSRVIVADPSGGYIDGVVDDIVDDMYDRSPLYVVKTKYFTKTYCIEALHKAIDEKTGKPI